MRLDQLRSFVVFSERPLWVAASTGGCNIYSLTIERRMLKMKYPTRIYYTETDKSLMWDRWQKGESLNSIARHFGRSHSSIQGVLARTGGIRPPQRRRECKRLSSLPFQVVSSPWSRRGRRVPRLPLESAPSARRRARSPELPEANRTSPPT